jgi:hypothetical protein
MSSVIIYMVIGSMFTGMVDILSGLLETSNRFNNLERIVTIILWPLGLIMFIYYIYYFSKMNNDDE